MAHLTPEQLQHLSVRTVEAFLNEKVPLSVGLAKEASALELNPEQIRRGVEAVNNITYLKILSVSPDRTVEFPLCKYAEVIDQLKIPDIGTPYLETTTEVSDLIEKVAEAPALEFPMHRIQGRLLKEASHLRREVEDLETKSLHIRDDLVSQVKAVQEDTSGLDKLASVCNDVEFKALSVLLTGAEVQPRHMPEGFFKTASLKSVNSLRELYLDAHRVSQALIEKRALQEKTEGLIKQAFIGSVTNLVGRGVGKVVGGTVKAPFKVAGRALGGVYNRIAAPIKSTQQARLATQTSKVGKASVKVKDAAKISAGVAGKVGSATAAVSTPMLYTPSTNRTTGAPIDVNHRIKTF